MIYLFDFLGLFPLAQEILIYRADPRIPEYEGSIEYLRYVNCKHWVVKFAQFSLNQLMIRVQHG